MAALPENGMVHLASPHTAPETMRRLVALLAGRGITMFARVDHAGEAEKAGLKMQPAQVLIFGSPKAGTPVMVAAPTVAIDLPLKALVWQDADGQVWLSYNSAEYLKTRHNIPDELVKNLAAASLLFEEAVK